MISRDRREKASGGRRNPSHTFQQKSTIASRTLNITRNGTISQGHYSICNPQHWFGYGTKDVFRNTTRRDVSLDKTTNARGSRARTELVLQGRARGDGWTGAFGRFMKIFRE